MFEQADAVRENIDQSRTEPHGLRNLLGALADVVCDVAFALDEKKRQELNAKAQREEISFADEIARKIFDMGMGETPSASQRDEARRLIGIVRKHDA